MTRSLLERLPEGALVTLDTAPIIYYLQDHPDYAPVFAPVIEGADRGELGIVISAVTLTEILTGPLQARDEILAARYRELLTRSPGWTFWPVDEEIAATAARVRAEYRLRTPDAIQIATAVVSRSHALITHDRRMQKVKGVTVLGVG